VNDWNLLPADKAYKPLGFSSPKQLREAAHKNQIPAVRRGRFWFFDLSALREWARAGGGNPDTPNKESQTASAVAA